MRFGKECSDCMWDAMHGFMVWAIKEVKKKNRSDSEGAWVSKNSMQHISPRERRVGII